MNYLESAFERFPVRAHLEEILQDTRKLFFYFQPDKKKRRARPRIDETTMTAATSQASFKQRLQHALRAFPRSFAHPGRLTYMGREM